MALQIAPAMILLQSIVYGGTAVVALLFAGFIYVFEYTTFFGPLANCCIGTTMTLRFPNQSRSYDATRRAVRFWGHDSSMECSFVITEGALKRVQPDLRFDEAEVLSAFDFHRPMISKVAANVYRSGRKGFYELMSSDFDRAAQNSEADDRESA